MSLLLCGGYMSVDRESLKIAKSYSRRKIDRDGANQAYLIDIGQIDPDIEGSGKEYAGNTVVILNWNSKQEAHIEPIVEDDKKEPTFFPDQRISIAYEPNIEPIEGDIIGYNGGVAFNNVSEEQRESYRRKHKHFYKPYNKAIEEFKDIF